MSRKSATKDFLEYLKAIGTFTVIAPKGYLDKGFWAESIYTLFDERHLSYRVKKTPDASDEKIVLMNDEEVGLIEALLKSKTIKKIFFLPNRYLNEEVLNLLDERCFLFCRDKESFQLVEKKAKRSKVYLTDDIWHLFDLKKMKCSPKEAEDISIGKRYSIWHMAAEFQSKIQTLKLGQHAYKIGYFLTDSTLPEAINITQSYRGCFLHTTLTKWLSNLFLGIVDVPDIVVTDEFYIALIAEKLGKTVFLWKDDLYKQEGISFQAFAQSAFIFQLEPQKNYQATISNTLKNFPFGATANSKKFDSLNPEKEADIGLKGISKKLPKVLIVLDHFIMGGVEKIACSVLPELTHEYQITLLLKRHLIDRKLIRYLRSKDIRVYYPPKLQDVWVLNYLWAKFFQMPRYQKLSDNVLATCDLIVDYNAFCLLPMAFSIHQTPKISFSHNSFTYLSRVLSPQLLLAYDYFVCLSQDCQKDWITKYPAIQNKLFQIYNPLDVEAIRKKALSDSYPRCRYFVSVQRLDIDKDTATIIKAFHLFCTQHEDTYLYIVGEGPQKSELIKLAENNKKIIFTGNLYNPYPIIKHAEALILSTSQSWGEGLGMVLLEAQALGTLAVSSNVKSGPAEILMNGKAGLLFSPSDERALARIMNNIRTNKIDKEKMISVAANHLNRFNKEKIVGEISSLFQKALDDVSD